MEPKQYKYGLSASFGLTLDEDEKIGLFETTIEGDKDFTTLDLSEKVVKNCNDLES